MGRIEGECGYSSQPEQAESASDPAAIPPLSPPEVQLRSRSGSPEGQRVLFVTSEISDFVKVGGLGEVSAALPRALNCFADVRVLIPGYREVVNGRTKIEIVGEFPGLSDIPPCALGRLAARDGLIVYVLICRELFERKGTPYMDPRGQPWADADLRFARLSLAAAQMAAGAGDPRWTPALLHLNDWPAAMAAGYLEWLGVAAPSILTIHNLAFQGLFSPERLSRLGIPDGAYALNGIEFHGSLSYLKAGIYYASHVTTVSETYAQEITQFELGCGLHGLLSDRAREGKLSGILNGIDESWEFDSRPGSRTLADPEAWKESNADAVRKSFGLGVSRGPLFAIVSRLVHQKGVDLSIDAADEIIAAGGQIVATGTGERSLEEAMLGLQKRHPESVGVNIGFDDAQARQMFAGSDFFLMPSRFEPCGLSQMYAQKFGSLPIAHRTGGLVDTIEDGSTGFLFSSFSKRGLLAAVERALATFISRDHIRTMRCKAMSRNFAWERSADRYSALYRSLS
jgi:starch synthase